MVRRRSMISTAIIPNSHIILILPSQPNVQVMILHNEVDESLQEIVALVLGKTVDAGNVVANRKDRVPACDGVGANDGVHRLEDHADVLGGATRAGEHF